MPNSRIARTHCASALILAASSAQAQLVLDYPDATEIRSSIADGTSWAYVPGVAGETVIGFLASRDPALAPPGSFTVVWLERVAPAQFTMEGWSDVAIEDAAAFVADRFADPDLFRYADFASSPMFFGGSTGGGLPPEETSRGMAISDPWQSVAQLLTPDDIGFLVDNGFAVGAGELSRTSEMPAPCPDEYAALSSELAGLAVIFEEQTFGVVLEASTLPAALTECCVAPQWCVKTYTWNDWGAGVPIASGAPSCQWTRSGTMHETCGFCCGVGQQILQ